MKHNTIATEREQEAIKKIVRLTKKALKKSRNYEELEGLAKEEGDSEGVRVWRSAQEDAIEEFRAYCTALEVYQQLGLIKLNALNDYEFIMKN